MSKFSETGVMIRQHQSLALSTLAADTALLFSDLTLVEDFRMLKSEMIVQLQGLTAGEGNGLLLGIANGELTAAEVAEALTVDGPVNANQRLQQEQATRFVKIIGAFESDGVTPTGGMFRNAEGGPLITVKPRWTFHNPEGWSFFIFNSGDALTTGGSATQVATHYGVWV